METIDNNLFLKALLPFIGQQNCLLIPFFATNFKNGKNVFTVYKKLFLAGQRSNQSSAVKVK